MKKFIFTLAVTMSGITAFSQDIIRTHKGETIEGKVTEMGDRTIKFKYSGEDMINSLSKNLVSEIKFESGRTQKVSEKIEINGEQDWEKVIITNLESDVAGLTRVGEIMAKAQNNWSYTTNVGKLEKKAMDKLKRDAAKQGCHAILILTTTSKAGNNRETLSGAPKASVTGVMYKY
ncbi:hypothetical protein [Leadbetterella sp. DM7]|uniref:hypothetical protein n=1 Tax=Leadbetterella sp. DM7 TaxID=3235085 RepID=UPI00349EAB2A